MQRWTKMARWINIFGSNMHMLEGSQASLPPDYYKAVFRILFKI
jgi:hypothetical protein